ncbi:MULTISPECIES: TIGR01440 family protein [Paenibacillus]|uniref:TIGR01440 family protein n=1 Tax=Paenibacillus TaxID=44249 RepID=UPI000E3DAE3F|nr:MULTISPECIES: TIGR01440 family protein [Paenibacillus]MDU8673371.1 TIGR01440 family protein [Paenibacillus polymyxa]MDU8698277.1 TIGR01440 family protein [Paenibacillus polymyxa]QDA27337.1 TIGR01440 family protein [Paenibacillus polymyxa]RFT99271.1 TIGR01440 family protein [Paenibacillus jamilae]RTZ34464.1 TIGR01440 family protein [Paenibacillus polymyxa]
MVEQLDHEISLEAQTASVVREVAEVASLKAGRLLVIGASTSEVAGSRIGTAGALDVAQQVLSGVESVRREYGFDVAFQCCEHLNRALVVERSLLERLGLMEVAAVPVRTAGGSMATVAYRSMDDACLAANVQAHAGIDIGETLIGMHLRPIAVPFRPSLRWIGEARVTAAFTRPPLIGGQRAVYSLEQEAGGNCD